MSDDANNVVPFPKPPPRHPDPAEVERAASVLLAFNDGDLDKALASAGKLLSISLNRSFASAVLAELQGRRDKANRTT